MSAERPRVADLYLEISRLYDDEDEREAEVDQLAGMELQRFVEAGRKAREGGYDARTFLLGLASNRGLEDFLATLFIAAKTRHRPLILQLFDVLNGLTQQFSAGSAEQQ